MILRIWFDCDVFEHKITHFDFLIYLKISSIQNYTLCIGLFISHRYLYPLIFSTYILGINNESEQRVFVFW